MAVLIGQPVIGQVQIDPGGFQQAVSGLSLHYLQRDPGLPQPVRQVCRSSWQVACSRPGAIEDRIRALGRQRPAAARALQHHEDPIGAHTVRAFVMQIIPGCAEEPARGWYHPVMPAALTVNSQQAPARDLYISQAQAQHLASAQPTNTIAGPAPACHQARSKSV